MAREDQVRVPGPVLGQDGNKHTAGDTRTKKEALQLAQAEELKIVAGTWVDPRKVRVTFVQYLEQVWFPRDAVVERYTQRAYWSSYTKHIKPFFGHRELRAIT